MGKNSRIREGVLRKMMAVDVKAGSAIETSAPKLLSQTRLSFVGYIDQYDVTGDGQRFLLLDPSESQAVPPITVITNWTSLLRR